MTRILLVFSMFALIGCQSDRTGKFRVVKSGGGDQKVTQKTQTERDALEAASESLRNLRFLSAIIQEMIIREESGQPLQSFSKMELIKGCQLNYKSENTSRFRCVVNNIELAFGDVVISYKEGQPKVLANATEIYIETDYPRTRERSELMFGYKQINERNVEHETDGETKVFKASVSFDKFSFKKSQKTIDLSFDSDQFAIHLNPVDGIHLEVVKQLKIDDENASSQLLKMYNGVFDLEGELLVAVGESDILLRGNVESKMTFASDRISIDGGESSALECSGDINCFL